MDYYDCQRLTEGRPYLGFIDGFDGEDMDILNYQNPAGRIETRIDARNNEARV